MPAEAAQQWVEWLLKTGLMHGIGLVAVGVAVAILLYGFFWLTVGAVRLVFTGVEWAPKIAKAHLDYLTDTRELNRNLATLTENEHSRTRSALSHMAAAGKEATTCPDVHAHLDLALNDLK